MTAKLIIKLLFKLGFFHSGFSGDGSRAYSRHVGEWKYTVYVSEWIGLLHPYNGRRNPITRAIAIYHEWSEGSDWRRVEADQREFWTAMFWVLDIK